MIPAALPGCRLRSLCLFLYKPSENLKAFFLKSCSCLIFFYDCNRNLSGNLYLSQHRVSGVKNKYIFLAFLPVKCRKRHTAGIRSFLLLHRKIHAFPYAQPTLGNVHSKDICSRIRRIFLNRLNHRIFHNRFAVALQMHRRPAETYSRSSFVIVPVILNPPVSS